MKRIGIDANTQKPMAVETAERTFSILQALGAEPCYAKEVSDVLGAPFQGIDGIEALLVIGGDGTILNRACWGMQTQIPLLGINLGHVGFLNNVEVQDLEKSLERLVQDHYTIFSRAMLESKVYGEKYYALNDFLIFKQHYSKTIDVCIHINGVCMANFACDGILVSTPTGSTAYSLSAGGPIVAPNVNALLLTPICPHTLSARPMLISQEDEITLQITDGHCPAAQVIVDGRCIEESFTGEEKVVVRYAERPVRFISMYDFNFFDLARKKLY